jgi:hypothetical protein
MADKIEGKQPQALTLPIGKHQLTMSMAAKLEQMQAGGAFPSAEISFFPSLGLISGQNCTKNLWNRQNTHLVLLWFQLGDFAPAVPEMAKAPTA